MPRGCPPLHRSRLPPAAGQTVAATCYACHQVDGQGADYGPDLKGWVATQGRDAFLEAVVNPSAGIAHGYDGASIKLKDGNYIHGLAYNRTDPVTTQELRTEDHAHDTPELGHGPQLLVVDVAPHFMHARQARVRDK